MPEKLCFLACRSLHNEVAAAIAAERWQDVFAGAVPNRCERQPIAWDALAALTPQDATQIIVLGKSCMHTAEEPPPGFTPTRFIPLENCFHLVAGPQLVTEAIKAGGYLMTPSWLANWREHLKDMGFEPEQSGNFFHGFAKELVLLDTGTDPCAQMHLAELQECLQLHARRIAVGLDYLRLLLARLVTEWRLELAQYKAAGYSQPAQPRALERVQ
jgi:hypothetical protein